MTLNTLCLVGYLAILVLQVTKSQTVAKSALEFPHAKVGVPYNDFKHCINQYILSTWQDDWNGAVANKLYSVKHAKGIADFGDAQVRRSVEKHRHITSK